MNVERARALWKKALQFALAVVGVGMASTAAVKHFAREDSCCKPGASCCYPGSPCCNHGSENVVSQR